MYHYDSTTGHLAGLVMLKGMYLLLYSHFFPEFNPPVVFGSNFGPHEKKSNWALVEAAKKMLCHFM